MVDRIKPGTPAARGSCQTFGINTGVADEISGIISECVAGISLTGKAGKSTLQPVIAMALRTAGFFADEEDTRAILPAGMPVWRSKDDGEIVPTRARRRIDIVVYQGGNLAALIETESDLNDLRQSGVTKRNGHYDVASIASRSDGGFFDSYNSIERMAAAAFYWSIFQRTGEYPLPLEATKLLESVASDDPRSHNPAEVPMFLISGFCREQDPRILSQRLKSLGAKLVCARGAQLPA